MHKKACDIVGDYMRGYESPVSPEMLPFETVVLISLVIRVGEGQCAVRELGTARIASESGPPDPDKPDRIVVVPDEPFSDGNQGARSFPTTAFTLPHPETGEPMLSRYNFAPVPPQEPASYSTFQ